MFYPILITVLILFAFFLAITLEMDEPTELHEFDPRLEKTSIDQPLAPIYSASLWDLSAEA
jgi:hypothetical protein